MYKGSEVGYDLICQIIQEKLRISEEFLLTTADANSIFNDDDTGRADVGRPEISGSKNAFQQLIKDTKDFVSTFAESRECELRDFAQSILSACNKTESGGDAYDALELLVRHPTLSYLKPNSDAALIPISVEISVGSFALENGKRQTRATLLIG